jgi:hypothetical protein
MQKYDIEQLGPLLCCPPKYHPIYMAMKACDDIELQQLYDDLRKYNDNKPLNSFLELEFKNRLNKPKEKKNELQTNTRNVKQRKKGSDDEATSITK